MNKRRKPTTCPDCQELQAENQQLREVIKGLLKRLTALEAQVAANSQNSSRPPASDGLTKRPAIARERGLRNPGKQPGTEGFHLAQVAEPDEVVRYQPDHCFSCGNTLDTALVVDQVIRQVHDIPKVQLLVTEHQAEIRRCACGVENLASFPDGVGAPTQYGPRIKALSICLVTQQHLPFRRACEILFDTYGATVSEGTVLDWVRSTAEHCVAPAVAQIAELLVTAPVIHLDETGARTEGKLGWVHSAGTALATHYSFSRRRGVEGMQVAGIVPHAEGILVHDGWAPYRKFENLHALCNAHHLRELQGLEELGQKWPAQMRSVLLDAREQVLGSKTQVLSGRQQDRLAKRYSQALKAGYLEIERIQESEAHSARKGKNLLHRLDVYREAVLCFTTERLVPFSNNQAEQDIRMVKLQQKISGCWRTERGIRAFLTLRSYLSTLRKNGVNPLHGLELAISGTPWLPQSG